MGTLLVIVGVVVAGSAVFAIAWVSSGPRFQGRSRGRRPDYPSSPEQEAMARAQAHNLNSSGTPLI
jgi:hypothetical protein